MVLALAAAAAVGLVSAGPLGAADIGPIDPTIADGDPGSLRDAVDNADAGDVIILQAGATYELTSCDNSPLQVGAELTIQGNGATIEQTCPGDGVILLRSSPLVLEQVTLTGGDTDEGGGVLMVGEGPALTLIESTITGNTACDQGGGIFNDTVGNVTLIRSTIAGNSADQDAAIDMDNGGELVVINSTITNNTSNEDGAVSLENGADGTILYATIARNIHGGGPVCAGSDTAEPDDDPSVQQNGEAANVKVDDDEGSDLTVFATVIAEPLGDAPNCESDSGTLTADSIGYNFSDDASCGLGAATDIQDGGSPGLGALAGNGGPTQTLLPQTGSTLIDGVADCAGGNAFAGGPIPTDQRGVVRPQGPACDIGAVEVVVAAVVVTPTFTG
jgi:hypothetical protein